jgi:hypothetical protein
MDFLQGQKIEKISGSMPMDTIKNSKSLSVGHRRGVRLPEYAGYAQLPPPYFPHFQPLRLWRMVKFPRTTGTVPWTIGL